MRTSTSAVIVIVAFLFSSCMQVLAQQAPGCDTTFKTHAGTQKTYTLCQNLQVQNATLAWSYVPGADNATGGVLDVAFTDTLLNPGGWVGWGINPIETDPQMVGSSVLIAFTDSSAGSIVLPYYLGSDLVSSSPARLVSAPLTDIKVLDSSVDIDATTLRTTIYATVQLKPRQTNLVQVWNKGPSVDGRSPNEHSLSATFLTSFGSLDVVNGTQITGGMPSLRLPNTHGILNAISWGILFPFGIMSARYMRPFAIFNPAWFYVHVGCQVSAYILGVSGFGTGLKIAAGGPITYAHRNIGIALVVFATVQILSLLLRPSPKHKVRKFWNVYHWTFGYTVLILGIINIFKGFNLLFPPEGWKRAYIAVLISLGAIALIFEAFTWTVWLRRRFKLRHESPAQVNGAQVNGSNGTLEKGSYAPEAK